VNVRQTWFVPNIYNNNYSYDNIQAKSCFALKSSRKWCLTATPIQNKLDDLFSLLHFLDLDPFGDIAWWNEMIKKPYEARGALS
jgi:DNA repair protein RAD5